jgi:hypothetical protein
MDDEVYEINSRDAQGKGLFTGDGFLVKAGSIARREIVPSAKPILAPIRQRLISEGVLEDPSRNLALEWRHFRYLPGP